MKKTLIFLVIITTQIFGGSKIFLRTSQVGFLPEDFKSAIILSTVELTNTSFHIVNAKNKKVEFKGNIKESKGEFGEFKHSYQIDFTKLKKEGVYKIVVKSYRSYQFKIGNSLFVPVVKELMKFFPVQRCGYTNPSKHKVCHIADATILIDDKDTLVNKKMDLTGGWHDAGDYVKFINTTALTTYTLLFSYDLDNEKFGFDYNNNNIPDILEEAKVGLDWMLRTQTDDNRFVTQVQNLQDHDVGWRLPENDTLAFNRPAYIGIGKNLIGIYSATMALAGRIWKETIKDNEFAEECLASAKKYYGTKDEVINVDSSGTGQYLDKLYKGKLALAAVELYEATYNRKYLNDARLLGIESGAEYWWSYGNVSTFAHYRLAKYDRYFVGLIKESLTQFNKNRKEKLFGEAISLGWGSNITQLGVAIQALLYENISKDSSFDTLKTSVRDYLLGKNQWGISFVSKIGSNYSKYLHHQVSQIKRIILPGGFAAGPSSKKSVEDYKLQFARRDKYVQFQTEFAYYRDDRMDYVTNEPTIIGNAFALLLFGFSK